MPAHARRVVVPRGLPPALRLPGPGHRVVRLAGATMGTTWSAQAVVPAGIPEGAVRRRLERRLDVLVAAMSTWEPSSAISRFNAAPAGTWHTLPPDLAAVLRGARKVGEESGGAFDPTLGGLTELWGFGPAGPASAPPSRADIAACRLRCGLGRIDEREGRVRQPGGLRLDLSGIAKGYAVDALSAELRAVGIRDALVEIGGELVGQGVKPDGSPWWVALERPPEGGRLPETVIALHGIAVATSGDYRRGQRLGDRLVSHTLDPRSGEPCCGGVASATVIAPSCILADAWATALTVLGPEEGMQTAERMGLPAHVLVRDGSGGLSERFSSAFAHLAA